MFIMQDGCEDWSEGSAHVVRHPLRAILGHFGTSVACRGLQKSEKLVMTIASAQAGINVTSPHKRYVKLLKT